MAAVLLAVAFAVFGANVALGEDVKPDGPAIEEGATVPDPPEPADEGATDVAPEPFTVPVVAEGGGCPGNSARFDNPVLHYSMCVPAGWGFTDFSEPGRLDELDSRACTWPALRPSRGRSARPRSMRSRAAVSWTSS
jgi:hypothetical protein